MVYLNEETSIKLSDLSASPNTPSPKINSYRWSSISWMKYTLDLSVTSINVSENTNFLEVVLAWVSLTPTYRVEVSIFAFSRMYFVGGAGFSDETVKLVVKYVPS